MTPVMRLLNQSQYFFSSMSVNAEPEKWLFSIIDIVAVLTESIGTTIILENNIHYIYIQDYLLQ